MNALRMCGPAAPVVLAARDAMQQICNRIPEEASNIMDCDGYITHCIPDRGIASFFLAHFFCCMVLEELKKVKILRAKGYGVGGNDHLRAG